jgi:hypothetical protein
MTGHDEHQQAKELSTLWENSGAPTLSRAEDELTERQRAKRMVGAIGDAILRERRRPQRWRFGRALSGLALAASLFGAIVAGRALLGGTGESFVAGPGVGAAAGVESLGGIEASGIVTLKRGRSPAVVDVAAVHAGDRITTAVKATARLTLGQTVQASVGEATEISIEARVTSTHHLRLDSGRIEATVDNRASAEPKLVVDTPDAQVVVTGTVLGIEVSRQGHEAPTTVTRVSVTEGHVEVRRGGQHVATINAGETWSVILSPLDSNEVHASQARQ